MTKAKTIRLSTKDRLATYRNALLTAMGVRADEQQPTDHQCLAWLQQVFQQAMHVTDPPITLMAHPPIPVNSPALKSGVIVVHRWDAKIFLPEWREAVK